MTKGKISVLTIQVVRDEIRDLTAQIKQEKGVGADDRIKALGEVLEKLNARHERLEKELLEEPDSCWKCASLDVSEVGGVVSKRPSKGTRRMRCASCANEWELAAA